MGSAQKILVLPLIVGFFALDISLSACGRSSGSEPNVVPAFGAAVYTPTNAACFANANYAGPEWGQYQSIGMIAYPGPVPSEQGLCGCPEDFIPACGPSVGIMCVPTEVIRVFGRSPAFYSWSKTGFHFNRFFAWGSADWKRHFRAASREGWSTGVPSRPGVDRAAKNHDAERGLNRHEVLDVNQTFAAAKDLPSTEVAPVCTTQVTQACLLTSPSGCAVGTCRPVRPGSNIGICAQ